MAGIYSDDESTTVTEVEKKQSFFARVLKQFGRKRRTGPRVPREITLHLREPEEDSSYLTTMPFYTGAQFCIAVRKYEADGAVFYRLFSERHAADFEDLKGDEALRDFYAALTEYDSSWAIAVCTW